MIIGLRHAESEANLDETLRIMKSDHSMEITKKGELQSLQAGQELEKLFEQEKITKCYVHISPYIRTQQTYNIVKQSLSKTNLIENIHPLIYEQFFNLMDERNKNLFIKERLQNKNRGIIPFHGMESVEELFNRAMIFISSLHPDEHHLIISHGHFLQMLHCHYNNVELSKYNEKQYQNCEFMIFKP